MSVTAAVAMRSRHGGVAHALAWNFPFDRLVNARDTDLVEFERACHDEAWGCAYPRGWRAYLDVIRELA